MAIGGVHTKAEGGPAWWPDSGRATHAVIDLDAIEGNVRAVRRSVAPAGVIAVVKANAYGHGSVMVAEAAVAAGAVMLAVATVDEGVELREAWIDAPILVLGPADPAEYVDAIRNRLTLTLATIDQVDAVAQAAGRADSDAGVQIKVDTGMRRYGAAPADVLDLARRIESAPNLHLTGVFTHFADADGPDLHFTGSQLGRFETVIGTLRDAGIEPGLAHCSNTAGAVRVSSAGQGAVRLGIGLYGLRPDDTVPLEPGMRPALTLRTRVAQVRLLEPGDTVSYGRTYMASAHERVALLPIGYADGLRRGLSGSGWVDIVGDRAPIRGRVCMDQTVVGCPNEAVASGDAVVVFGDGHGSAPSLSDVAKLAGTITYEIATGIAHRVPRWYLRHGQPIATLRGSRLQRL